MSRAIDVSLDLCELAGRLKATANSFFANTAQYVYETGDTKTKYLSICEYIEGLEREYHTNDHAQLKQLARIVLAMMRILKEDRRSMVFSILLFSNLILRANQSGLPTIILQRGFQRALQLAIQCCDVNSSIRLGFQWRNQNDVLAIIQSRLLSHQVASWQCNTTGPIPTLQTMSTMVLSAFLMVMRGAQTTSAPENISAGLVAYQTLIGPSVDDSKVLGATLLIDIPVTRDVVHSMSNKGLEDVIVALFDCSLELPGWAEGQQVELSHNSNNNTSELSAEHQLLDRFVDMLLSSHVTLVGCQKRVHPYLIRRLRRANIACIPRISVKYMGALVRLSGARQLSSIPTDTLHHSDTLTPSCLGYLSKARYMHMCGKPLIVMNGFSDPSADDTNSRQERIQNRILQRLSHLPVEFLLPLASAVSYRQRDCVSIVLTAPTERHTVLWQTAMEDCLQHLRRLSTDSSTVLPGGGIWQAQVAHQLQAAYTARAASETAVPLRPTEPEPVRRVARQLRQAEMDFTDALKECAVLGGAARTQQLQRSPDGEGWDINQLFEQFQLPARTDAPLQVDLTQPVSATLRNPDGDQVFITRGTALTSSLNAGASRDLPYFLDTTRRLSHAHEIPPPPPPLESLSGCLQALQIATEAACALLDVDGIYYTGAES